MQNKNRLHYVYAVCAIVKTTSIPRSLVFIRGKFNMAPIYLTKVYSCSLDTVVFAVSP